MARGNTKMMENGYWPKRIKLFLLDSLLVCAASFAAYLLRFDGQIPPSYFELLLHDLPLLIALRLAALYFFKIYTVMWRYSSIADLIAIVKANTLSTTFFVVIVFFLTAKGHSRSIVLMDWLIFTALISFSRVSVRLARDLAHFPSSHNGTPVLIYGAGDSGERLARAIKYDSKHNYNILGFADDDPKKLGARIHGAPVLTRGSYVPRLAKELNVKEVIVTFSQANRDKMRQLIAACSHIGVSVKITPRWEDIFLLSNGQNGSDVREVQIEDLLRREPVHLNLEQIKEYVYGRRVLITGAGGSIGAELCRQVAKFRPSSLALVEQNEFNLYKLNNELRDRKIGTTVKPILADVTHRASIERIMKSTRPHVVFHAAAHKHVPIVESNAAVGFRNNVLGTRNVVDSAVQYGVEHFVLISTDKAVRPTGVMGASKRLVELLIQNMASREQGARFVTVRFGNVLGTAGSVVPMFQEQIQRGGPITITHPDVRRYFMTITEAVQLVLQAASMAEESGETFVLNMGDPIRIVDLAKDLIFLMGKDLDEIRIEYTGLQSGEKLFEELLAPEETLIPTGHSKLFLAESSSNNKNSVEAEINQLLMIAETMDNRRLKRELAKIFPSMKADPNGAFDGDKQRLLIVDDDPGVRDAMREFLRNQFDVMTAGSGEEAINLVENSVPDLVLLDVRLPGLSGLDVCRHIKENPTTENVPVLMMSGYYVDTESPVEAMECGADDFLRKPAQLQEVESKIKTILARAKA